MIVPHLVVVVAGAVVAMPRVVARTAMVVVAIATRLQPVWW
jgi:hypothetical protein